MPQRRELLIGLGSCSLSALISTSGCALLEGALDLQKPTAKVTGFKITHASLTELGTLFDIQLHNPNPFGFTLQGIRYDMLVNNHRLTSGESKKKIALKAHQSSETQLAFRFALAETAQGLLSLLEKTKASYALNGAVRLGSARRNIDVPLKHRGHFDLPQLPGLLKGKLSYKGLKGSDILLSWNAIFKNANSFRIPTQGISASWTLNGRPVLKSTPSMAKYINAKGQTSLRQDLKISLSRLGLAAIDLASKPSIDWRLRLGLNSGGLELPYTQKGRLKLRI